MGKLLTYKEAAAYFEAAGFKRSGIYPYVHGRGFRVVKDGKSYVDEEPFIKAISEGPKYGRRKGSKGKPSKSVSLDSIILGSLDASVRSILSVLAKREDTTIQALSARIINGFISNRIKEHMVALDLGDV